MAVQVKQRARVRFKLQATLKRLREAEESKPPGERAIVPSPAQIAGALGTSTKGLLNMERGKLLNLGRVGAILDLLRAQGLEVELSDLLIEERPPGYEVKSVVITSPPSPAPGVPWGLSPGLAGLRPIEQ